MTPAKSGHDYRLCSENVFHQKSATIRKPLGKGRLKTVFLATLIYLISCLPASNLFKKLSFSQPLNFPWSISTLGAVQLGHTAISKQLWNASFHMYIRLHECAFSELGLTGNTRSAENAWFALALTSSHGTACIRVSCGWSRQLERTCNAAALTESQQLWNTSTQQ